MTRLKKQYQLLETIALDFEDFKPFNFEKEFKSSENKYHLQSKL